MSTSNNLLPLYVPAGSGTPLNLGDKQVRVAVNAAATGNIFSLFVAEAAPKSSVPAHVHMHEDETFYILEGLFTGRIGDQTWEAGPGDTLYAPRQVIHSWTCISETPGRLLNIATPGQNFETFFSRMETTVAGAQEPELGARISALAREHGMAVMPQQAELDACNPTQSPIYVPAGGGPVADLGDQRCWVKIGAHQTENALLLTEFHVDNGGGAPPHIHHREDETFHILEGKFEFQVGGKVIEASPGDTIFAPRGIAHTFKGTCESGSRMLIWTTPGDNFQTFAMGMAERGIVPGRDMTNPAIAQEFIALAARHGIDMLPPSTK